MWRCLVFWSFITFFSSVGVSNANHLGFLEKYVLSKDQAKALKALPPGSRDAFYYYALFYQAQGRLSKVDQVLKVWKSRYSYDSRRKVIENRQSLLRYAKNPKVVLKALRSQFRLTFTHQKKSAKRVRRSPSQFKQELISFSALAKRVFRKTSVGHRAYEFQRSGLIWLSKQKLTQTGRRNLLKQIKRPDFPNLLDLIHADLAKRSNSTFGQLSIHYKLTQKQLDALAGRRASLLAQKRFVDTYLQRLLPLVGDSPNVDLNVRDAYLKRLEAFAKKLPVVHNSFKMAVGYFRLELSRKRGIFDRKQFINFIKIPHHAPYINRSYYRKFSLSDHRAIASLLRAKSYSIGMSPIGGVGSIDEERLVRDYLQHFFVKDKNYQSFSKYLKRSYLRPLFAITKILHGVGNVRSWSSWLRPSELKSLKERTDLLFSRSNSLTWKKNQIVTLGLITKNVSSLLVRVYRINAFNYYRKHKKEVPLNLDLDGLAPNQEKIYRYTSSPWLRKTQLFTFASTKKPGIYIIDFIGGSKSCRALIHKGKIRVLERKSIAGHAFTVLNQIGQKARNAWLSLSGRVYKPREDGEILIPYTKNPRKHSFIVGGDGLVSLDSFSHLKESYSFTAGIYVDRESLLSGKQAIVMIRPTFQIHGQLAPFSLLKKIKLTMNSTDRFGIKNSKIIPHFQLFEGKESTYTFRVPEHLSRIEFVLTAKVKNISKQKEESFSAKQSFQLNGINQTKNRYTAFLRKASGHYFVYVLGRTGEPISGIALSFWIRHQDFRRNFFFKLQTDKQGRLELGALQDIQSIGVRGEKGIRGAWKLAGHSSSKVTYWHRKAGEVIRVPYFGSSKTISRKEFSLFKTCPNEYFSYLEDSFEALKIEDGFIVIRGLSKGVYEFFDKRNDSKIFFKLAKGQVVNGHIQEKHRLFELSKVRPLHISQVTVLERSVTFKVSHLTKNTRVHVFATHFLPVHSIEMILKKKQSRLLEKSFDSKLSDYREGRRIGSEHRYILMRKYAKKFAGNMLKRPRLLLNPWETKETSTGRFRDREGQGWGSKRRAKKRKPRVFIHAGSPKLYSSRRYAHSLGLDFLPNTTRVFLNLKPDAKGKVVISRKKLKGHSFLRMIAVNPWSSTMRTLDLPEQAWKPKDLRLSQRALPVKLHFSEQKSIQVVRKGKQFVLKDITTSKFKIFDSLPQVYRLYNTLNKSAQLKKFSFILRWPKMTEKQKSEKYQKYASHELNFFIYKKDPAFFKKVLLPYLANKKEKTFLDKWLLNMDLRSFLKPWLYQRLNVVEKILLGHRIGSERPYTRRYLFERSKLLSPEHLHFERFFQTSLSLAGLDKGGLDDLSSFQKNALHERGKYRLVIRSASTENERSPKLVGESKKQDRPDLFNKKTGEEKEEGKEAETNEISIGGHAGKRGGLLSLLNRGPARTDLDKDARQKLRQFYQKLGEVKEWAENNYYKLSINQQNADLVKVSSFWVDYSKHSFKKPFYSKNFARASRNFTEMMFALSVLDLPFQSPKHERKIKAAQMNLKAKGGMIIFHKQIQKAKKAKGKASILLSQSYFRNGERYIYVNGEKREKFVQDEFLTGTVYGVQVIVTNPTSSTQKLDILWQIPKGALPVQNGRYTHSFQVRLGAFQTRRYHYFFYFPYRGKFSHYPVHISKKGKWIASARVGVLTVVLLPTKVDKSSWAYVSQNASNTAVLTYLKTNNLQRINLGGIAWRMKKIQFFKQVIRLLARNHRYDQVLWSYGLFHNDPASIQAYLRHRPSFLQSCGKSLESPLLTINPIVRKTYQHLEYSPLVNARTHRFGAKRKIANRRLLLQYKKFLEVLQYRKSLSDVDKMAIVYYLLLQDRLTEALTLFEQIDASKLATRIQYDYFQVYLAFSTENVKLARRISEKYKKYPVLRWRKLFANALSQLKEIETKETKQTIDLKGREQRQERLADSAPSFSFKLLGEQVDVRSQNIKQFTVNYYRMDIELLFSRNPFVQKQSGQFAFIQPNFQEQVKVGKSRKTLFKIPKKYQQSNLMIEIVAAGTRKAKASLANRMEVQIVSRYGRLKVYNEQTRKSLPKVYVKVYAKMKNGSVRFYKDGYTDLRGLFDYASSNTGELSQVKRFALLLLSEKDGAVIKEVIPPKE